jgi:hypothetical protein
MNKDIHQIFETYKSTSANKEILEEGLFDRLKARGSQAVGAVKGFGQQAAGTVKGALAGATGNVSGVQAASQQRAAGAIQGEVAKLESYKQSAIQIATKAFQQIANDISKLKITSPNTKAIVDGFIQASTAAITHDFDLMVQQLKQQAGVRAPAAGTTGTAVPVQTTPQATDLPADH